MTVESDRRRAAELPAWFPPWAAQLAELYFSGTTAAFVLHGNTDDLFRIDGDAEQVMMAKPALALSPAIAAIITLEVSVARCGIQPPGCRRMRCQRVCVVRPSKHTVMPCAASVIRVHERARLDAREEAACLVRVGLEPANVVRFRARRKAPRRSGGQ